MKRSNLFIVAGIVVGLVFATGCGKPEDKLAKHSEAMGKIMEDNVESPKEGVEELHSYLQANLPEIMKLTGEAMVELDEIEDPKERAERAKEMATTLKEVAEKMQESGMKFSGAVMTNEDAMKYGTEWAKSWEATAEALSDVVPMGIPGM